MIILADLTGGDVDQTLLETAALAVVDRATQVLAGEAPVLAPRTLRLDLTDASAAAFDEAYEVVDGVLIGLYDDDEALQAARVATYSGSFDAYAGSVTASIPGGEEGDPTPIGFGATLIALPSADDADLWLGGLPDRLGEDPLRGYLSFSAVADAPDFGDASATYTFQRQIGDEVATGFRVYVRVGSEIAVVEYASVAGATLADIEALVAAQIACLEAVVCPAAAQLPGGQAGPSTPPADDGDADEDAPIRRAGQDDGNQDAGDASDVGTDEAPAPEAESPGGGVVDVAPTEEPTEEEEEGGVREVGG